MFAHPCPNFNGGLDKQTLNLGLRENLHPNIFWGRNYLFKPWTQRWLSETLLQIDDPEIAEYYLSISAFLTIVPSMGITALYMHSKMWDRIN